MPATCVETALVVFYRFFVPYRIIIKTMDAKVRKASLEDVDEIVKIHQSAFKDFFLTSLGSKFLRLYYSTFINSNDGVVFCAKKEGKIVGFSACSYVSRGFNTKLIKSNIVGFGLESLRLMFMNPKAILRLVKNLNKLGSSGVVKDDGAYAELYSIAVNPKCQGEGIGKFLLTVTESDVKEHNDRISLTTDYYNNKKTKGFYLSLGYADFYDFTTYPDRRMWRMIKYLNK